MATNEVVICGAKVAGRYVLERTAIGADGGADGAANDDFVGSHDSLLC